MGGAGGLCVRGAWRWAVGVTSWPVPASSASPTVDPRGDSVSRGHPDPVPPAWPSAWGRRRCRRGRWSARRRAGSSPRWWRTPRPCAPWSSSWVSRGDGDTEGVSTNGVRLSGGPCPPRRRREDAGTAGVRGGAGPALLGAAAAAAARGAPGDPPGQRGAGGLRRQQHHGGAAAGPEEPAGAGVTPPGCPPPSPRRPKGAVRAGETEARPQGHPRPPSPRGWSWPRLPRLD